MRLAQNCYSCRLSQTRRRIVWGDGPTPCRLMFIGEAPGMAEDRAGKPFVGPSGKELEYMLWRNGIRREEIYITNVCKCRPKDNDDPTQEDINACTSQYLTTEIRRVQPQLIVALGRIAARWLLQETAPPTMELVHGFLYRSANDSAYGYDTLPCYHPAAGLHNPSLLAQCQWDLKHIKPALAGRLPYGPRVGAQPEGLQYEIVQSQRQIDELLAPDGAGVVAIDTETTGGGKPWCLTASTQPGVSAMVMAADSSLCGSFAKHIKALQLTPIIHNLMFDHPVLASMGVRINPSTAIDTMVMAYQLQFLPRGLKPLAYRLAGITMESYEETVRPAQVAKAMDYLHTVEQREWPNPEPVMTMKPDGTPHIKKPQNIRAKVRRALLDIDKGRCDDPRARWLQMEGREVVEDVLGPMPNGWLSDLPLDVAKGYACQDADATRRIYPALRRLCEERGMI